MEKTPIIPLFCFRKNQIYSPFRKPIFIIHLRKIFFELRITSYSEPHIAVSKSYKL